MACIPPNPRRVGYIDPIHGPLDGPLYMGSIYSNTFCMYLRFRSFLQPHVCNGKLYLLKYFLYYFITIYYIILMLLCKNNNIRKVKKQL